MGKDGTGAIILIGLAAAGYWYYTKYMQVPKRVGPDPSTLTVAEKRLWLINGDEGRSYANRTYVQYEVSDADIEILYNFFSYTQPGKLNPDYATIQKVSPELIDQVQSVYNKWPNLAN